MNRFTAEEQGYIHRVGLVRRAKFAGALLGLKSLLISWGDPTLSESERKLMSEARIGDPKSLSIVLREARRVMKINR